MNFRRPPALANWLLDRFGDTWRNPALAGDLLEEFRNGRSPAWYWRQSLVAIANSIARNAIVLRPYLLVLGAAYAVQFAVSLTLWKDHFPPPVHAARWIRVVVYVLLQIIFAVSGRWVNRFVAGVSNPNLRRMYCAVESGPPRSTILALAAWESFYLGLASYGLCALVFARFSLADLVHYEMSWFVLWELAPALAPMSAPATEAEIVEEEQPRRITESSPSLTVVLSNGRTIILEPQSVAQSVFAAADQELIAVVFGKCRSLEVVRSAVWFGSCQ